MTDKNLFPYNLAIVAIFKNEAPYLREWIDYHLLAGADHFYLYNNDSSDDYEKILAPYVEANLVTLIDYPGKSMQMHAYNDALEQFRFFCRYMAFIDLDEFVFPKTGQSIVEVVDEILLRDEHWAALAMNFQYFGSNGHESADFSKGVLERFTRRAPSDWIHSPKSNSDLLRGNIYVKSIINPRLTDYFGNPHCANHFAELYPVNENGGDTWSAGNFPITAEKIVVNHYYTKSKEEYLAGKRKRGWACQDINIYDDTNFYVCDRNEVFDDGILNYRLTRAQNFSLESDGQRRLRVEKALIDTLTQISPFEAPADFFVGKLETFLTCRKLAEVFGTQIYSTAVEKIALERIYQTLDTDGALTYADLQLFVEELPEILSRPFPVAKKIAELFYGRVLPAMSESAKYSRLWKELKDINFLRRMLNLVLR